jgi:hypothetical protein
LLGFYYILNTLYTVSMAAYKYTLEKMHVKGKKGTEKSQLCI